LLADGDFIQLHLVATDGAPTDHRSVLSSNLPDEMLTRLGPCRLIVHIDLDCFINVSRIRWFTGI
jgi:hypothetical protein